VNLTAGQTETKCKYCDSLVTSRQAETRLGDIKNGKSGGTFLLAELARAGGNSAEALNYYNKVIEEDGKCAEAWLGKGLSMLPSALTNMETMGADLAGSEMPQALTPCMYAIQLAKDREAMRKRVIAELSECVIAGSEYMQSLEESAKLFHEMLDSESGRRTMQYALDSGVGSTLYDFDRHNAAILHYAFVLLAIFKEDPRSEVAAKAALAFCRSAFKSLKEGAQTLDAEEFKTKESSLDGFINSLRELNPELAKKIEESLGDQETKPSSQPQAKPASSNAKSGCFVATACYGDYDHPAVMELRQFRDRFLEPSDAGRAFIRWYYKWAPPFADLIARTKVLRALGRALIVRPSVMIARIMRQK
jgi:tetratricopeptide (TPR) repeat protein